MGSKIYFEKFGSPKVLEEDDGQLLEPAAGDVQVESRAIGVNPVDWKVVAEYLQNWAPVEFPAVPGTRVQVSLSRWARMSRTSRSVTRSSGRGSPAATSRVSTLPPHS
ncbi:hypothetical protein [Rhodococcus wratislaviensis]|uniref:hypothetical protein n=1 Tax=Rhodococcus wratislaviensis TaxID=44752 RepID=UPI000F5725EC|nr:hypothetical protein [Rhodococcus wratislaviensis]